MGDKEPPPANTAAPALLKNMLILSSVPTLDAEREVELTRRKPSAFGGEAADVKRGCEGISAEALRPTQPEDSTEAARSSSINFLTCFAVAAAGASAAGFGYENAIIGPLAALPAFVERYQSPSDTASTSSGYVFTAVHQNILFSIPLIGSIIGAVLATPLQNRFGRRGSLLLCYALSLAPLVLELFAPNLAAFVLGRFWNGIYYGVALAVGPLFLADLVPAAIRGRAVSSQNILTVGSQTLATVTVWATESRQGALSYKIPLAVQCAIPVVLIALTLPLPESPAWLVSKGRRDAARRSLARLRSSSAQQVSLELAELIKAEEDKVRMEAKVHFWDIFRQSQLERTMVSALIFSLNQCSGIILSTTFSALFLVQLGVAQPFLLNVASSLCQLAGAITAPLFMDRVGRRPLAIYGIAFLALIDFTTGALAFYINNERPQIAMTIAALSFIFNFFWTLSFYSISLLTPSEYPAVHLRTPTMSYAIFNGQVTAVVTTFVVPQLTAADAAGLGAKTYMIFGAMNVVFVLLAYVYLPETAGRTPREIEELYRSGLPKRAWATASVGAQCSQIETEESMQRIVTSTTHATDKTANDAPILVTTGAA
ncbi:hypothetical protein K437DRAFT_257444 [Tilletiaria anomala UBC 951]|uniref:Major facilitator superfamily (MFS) profile domain-containing protein n=1 Tax=Tilletiaria anomala (strain ATCC 24038 / CBS 436.72 / UBC 951) TaxID=1037660 RepID=A0A066VXK4_TILAU|nr:uncharacterized protein K437DRAFT_257444 [Tilletiaria anomala UBC 951]KDN43549.1 hypothetical protein K437DRAFT_257444 [Tilletiaria anomala UBC 951]